MANSGWPNSTGWPLAAITLDHFARHVLSISFISFMASTMHSTWPYFHLSPERYERRRARRRRLVERAHDRRLDPRGTSLRARPQPLTVAAAALGALPASALAIICRASDRSAALEPAAPANLMRTFMSARSRSNSAIPLAFRKSTSSRNSCNLFSSMPNSSRAFRAPSFCSFFNPDSLPGTFLQLNPCLGTRR